jgi:hypothetical protein
VRRFLCALSRSSSSGARPRRGESQKDFLARARAAILSRMTRRLPLLLGDPWPCWVWPRYRYGWTEFASVEAATMRISELKCGPSGSWLPCSVWFSSGRAATTSVRLGVVQALREFLTSARPAKRPCADAPVVFGFLHFGSCWWGSVGMGFSGLDSCMGSFSCRSQGVGGRDGDTRGSPDLVGAHALRVLLSHLPSLLRRAVG